MKKILVFSFLCIPLLWNIYSQALYALSSTDTNRGTSFDNRSISLEAIFNQDIASTRKNVNQSSSVINESAYKTLATFQHPGIFYTLKELEFVKAKIEAKEEPWNSSYAKLLATNPTSRVPKAYSIVPGSSDPKERHDMDEMTKDGEYAHASALLWYFTGDQKYANHAIQILNAWSIFKKIPMPLYLTWAAPHFINAAELLKHTPNSGWNQADIDKFSVMVRDEMWRQVDPPAVDYGSNHGTTANEAQFAIAVFLDDKAKFDEAVVNFKWVVPKYIFMNTANRINGQANETCRDLNHTKLGVLGIFYAAQTAWNQGTDLWTTNATRFTAFAELHAGFMTGRTAVPSTLCAEKSGQAGKVYCQGNVAWSEPTGAPPCNETAWEILYNHLNRRLGRSLPHTEFMLNRNRPQGDITRRTMKWETLIHANQTYSAVVPPTNIASIPTITVPSTVDQGQTVTATVDYNTSEARDIVVLLQLGQSPWTTYVEVRKSVNAGSGKIDFTLNIPANTPIASQAYQFQAFMTPTGGAWENKVANMRQTNVTVGGAATLSVNDSNAESKISVYPNPSRNGVFYLSAEVPYEVFDIQGKIVEKKKGSKIDLSSEPKGIYVLRLETKYIKLIR